MHISSDYYKGLMPKEQPKYKTVRDVKKRENERKVHKDRSRKYINGDAGDSSHDSSFGSDWNSSMPPPGRMLFVLLYATTR